MRGLSSTSRLLTALLSMSVLAMPAFGDDGELLRKSMSSAAGSVEDPVPEADHAFIDFMKLYVPAQNSAGESVTVSYVTADGVEEETRDDAKPLIGVYMYGPAIGIEGTGFVGHGARDAFAAVSLDDGNTWKRTNLSDSADKSSFTVSVPFPDPTDSGDISDDIEFDPDGLEIDSATLREIGPFDLLVIDGGVADRWSRVEIRDALTQETIASAFVVRRSGEWYRVVLLRDEVPCFIQAGVDGVFGPAIAVEGAPEDCAVSDGPTMITEYPGDVINMFHAVAGNRVVVAWPSRFCQTGSPAYAMDDTEVGAVAAYLGIDTASDLYLTDLFGVGGAQGSVDYSDDEFEQNQAVGEVPYACLWTARGVLVEGDDPNTTAVEENHMEWFKAERLTSGRRDVNRVEIKMVEGAGAAITWQEDPEGLRPGQGEGPGEGWSGAIAHNQTDIWYSFLPWESFDIVDDNGEPVALDEYTGTETPKHYVPFAVPMRLTNNARCNANGTDDEYCFGVTASPFGLPDLCADTVEIPQGQNQTGDICVSESGLPNVSNTAATRPRLSLQPRDTDGDGAADSAWVVVVAEEDKGFGRYFFQVGETDVDTATACVEGEESCEVADDGKNIWYYSFDMGDPATSADMSDSGLVANLVSQGNLLNQPETDWRTGAFYPPMDTLDMWDFSDSAAGQDYNFLIYRTEIARRGSLLVQSTGKASLGSSGLVALPAWKQGLINQGGPADVMVRRIVDAGASANPYDFDNLVCAERLFDDGSNPYYPKGICTDPAINLSAVTPETCEASGSSDGTCPTIDADGITADDPADQQVFDKMLTWFQCPGSDLCGTTDESQALGDDNLDDQSWHNPLDIAKGHRGFLDGDFVMVLYAWSPNYKLNRVGTDRYELYIRRSFDGGVTWTTTPASFTGTDGVTVSGSGTTTCETMRDGATSQDDSQRCLAYGPGEPEQARNVSQLQSMAFTILDPRYAPSGGPTGTSVLDEDGLPTYETTDVRNASRYFVVYETGDNTTTAEGEPEPLDLNYGRAVMYGDHYQVWAEEDTDPSLCLPTDSVDPNFCNEFDDLEGRRDTESSEASLAASPAGDFLYGVWAQALHEEDELAESDAMFRRVWYLDGYIPSDAPTE